MVPDWRYHGLKTFPKKATFSTFCPVGSKKSLQVGLKDTSVKARSAPYLMQVESWPISNIQ